MLKHTDVPYLQLDATPGNSNPKHYLTPRQEWLWDFMLDFQDRHGYPASRRDMCVATGVASTNAVSGTIAALIRKGFAKEHGRHRTAVAVDPAFRPTAKGFALFDDDPAMDNAFKHAQELWGDGARVGYNPQYKARCHVGVRRNGVWEKRGVGATFGEAFNNVVDFPDGQLPRTHGPRKKPDNV